MIAPQVDVHGIDLALSDDEVARFANCLDDGERRRAERFRFERDRRRFVVAHAGLRHCLATLLGQPPETLRFIGAAFQKPRLEKHEDCHFNLSHAADLALVAICASGPVGVDLERLRAVDDMDGVVREVFTDRERAALRATAPEARRAAFFHGWTRKEALIKATGDGLRADLTRIGVTLAPGVAPLVTQWPDDSAHGANWQLASFMPRPGYVAAVACRGAVAPRLRLHALPEHELFTV